MAHIFPKEWLKDKSNLDLFLNGAMGALKTSKQIADTADRSSIVFRSALREWGYPDIMEQFDSPVDGLSSFSIWLKTWAGWSPKMSIVNLSHISVCFSVPFGNKGARVDFQADALVTTKEAEKWTPDTMQEAYRELWEFAAQGYIGFAKNPPSLVGAAGNQPLDTGEPRTIDGIELKDCILCEMTHLFKEGKTDADGVIKYYYRLFGGRFSQHGVMVWPEVLERAGIDPEKIKPGKKTLRKGGKMWVLLAQKDGKEIAKKVVQIEKGQ